MFQDQDQDQDSAFQD